MARPRTRQVTNLKSPVARKAEAKIELRSESAKILDFVVVSGICNTHKAASLPCCCVKKIPCDITAVVNADGVNSRSIRNIEHGDVSFAVPQEIVASSNITEIAHNLTRIVDAGWLGS